MKRFINNCLFFLSLFLMMAALLPACKKTAENAGPPTVTGVRSYVASPNDTILHSAVANGQWVVITGQNLQNATKIEFDGVPASFNPALFAANSAVVQIPSIMFSKVDTTKLYTLRYETAAGSATFAFKLGPAKPTITAISNVFANPGDSVYIYGTNLVLVQDFSYAGTKIPSFKMSDDGTSLGFLMPAGAPTGVVSLTTKAGKVIFNIVATPTITGVSNENGYTDDTIYVYGTYLKNIQSLTFAGTTVTSFTSSSDGS